MQSTEVRRQNANNRPRHDPGASTIDIIFALVGVGVLAYGGWWIFKTMGQAGKQYADGMIAAQNQSTEVMCQMNMRSIWQGLQLAATGEGRYPDTRSELARWCGDVRVLRCPDPNGGEYLYRPPRRIDDERPSLLIFDANAVHDDRHCVLLSNGQIALVTGDELLRMLPVGQGRPR